MIKLNKISKIYSNGVKALDEVDLVFDKQELVFITGESGNGKSTLLNIIGCLDNVTSGELIINGSNISTLSQKDIANLRNSYFGFVFQEFYLDDNLTVIENIRMPLEKGNYNVTNELSLAQDLGISNLLDRKPSELSGGERQRVQIMRSLIKNPYVILADEPTGNLDEKIKKDIYDIFKELSKTHLVIIVSHDLEAAKNYATRIINLSKGKIVSDNKFKKTTLKVNDKVMSSYEVLDYINNYDSNELNLKITKEEVAQETVQLEKVELDESKNISNSFVKKYNKALIKKNKENFIFNIIILSILLPFLMWLFFFINYDSKNSVNKYLDKNFYDYYVLYNEVNYTNDLNEDYTNYNYTGKNMYNDLLRYDLEVNPIVNVEAYFNDQSISTNIMYDNTLELTEIEISDYYAVRNNVKINDLIIINDNEYKVSNIFKTDYENYSDIIYSTESKVSSVRSNILNYHVNYVKLNYESVKSNSLYVPFSNFTLTAFKKYSNSYNTILSSSRINTTLKDNEIIISTRFASLNNIGKDSIGKTFKFIDIKDNKYNNYYDNEISLSSYYENGLIIKGIVDETTADYYVSDNIFNSLVKDYDYYKRPSYYLVKNSSNLKNVSNYKINEANINNMYIKGESFKETNLFLNLLFYVFVILTSLYTIMFIGQFISKNKRNIGLFKSYGFENNDIKKIYNRYILISNVLILVFSTIIYNITYLIYENKCKNKMLYNQIFEDKYLIIVYIVLVVYLLICALIKFISFKKIDKEQPINIIR